ncbi:MAG TPA: Ig-like domain-containing protein [Gemmataceae bacterium]|nr:Ig-like domain-containing protein [Gemmataceae bacterium]
MGTPVSLTITITSDSGPFTVVAGSLHVPDGVTVSGGGSNLTNTGGRNFFFNQSTFTLTISGTPTDQGTGNGFALIDPEAFNTKDDASLEIQTAISEPPLDFSLGSETADGTFKGTASDTEGISGPVSVTAIATVGPTPTISFDAGFSTTPNGISVQVSGATATITGAADPGTAGIYTLFFTATNGVQSNNDTITLRVSGRAPVAQDISATTTTNTPVTIDPAAVDTDPGGLPLTVTSTRTTDHGEVAILNNKILYGPNRNFTGTDTFTYTVTNSEGLSSLGTITVTVGPAKEAWTGLGNGNWNDALDWSDGVPFNGEDLVFPAGAEKTTDCVDNIKTLTVGNVEIDAGYTISAASGAALTVTNNVVVAGGGTVCKLPITITGAVDTFTVHQGARLALAAALSGKGNLSLAGAGELDLNVDNPAYQGSTTLLGGTLVVGTAKALGTGALVIDGGSDPVTLAPALKSLTLTNELDLAAGTVAFLSGAWTFAKQVVVKGSTEIDPEANGLVASQVTLQGGVTTPAGSPILTVGGTGVLTLSGPLDANTAVLVSKGATVALGSKLHGVGTISVSGILSSGTANSWAGQVTLNDRGAIFVGASGALGTARVLVVSSQGSEEGVLQAAPTVPNPQTRITLKNAVEMNNAANTANDAGLLIERGNLSLTGAFTMDGNSEIDAAANTTLALVGGITGASTLSVGGAGTVQLGGVIADDSTVTAISAANGKATGPGTVQLLSTFGGHGSLTVDGGNLQSQNTLVNLFYGTITLKQGTIQVGANAALGSGTLYVNAAAPSAKGLPVAFLQGTGTLDNKVLVKSDGTSTGPLGIGFGSQLVLASGFVVSSGKGEIVLKDVSGTKLTLRGVIGGQIDVAGDVTSPAQPGFVSEVDLEGTLFSEDTVRAVSGGVVEIGSQLSNSGGTVQAAGGTLMVHDASTGELAAFSSSGATLQSLRAFRSGAGAVAPPNISFPVGFFGFTLIGIAPGKTATVTITLGSVFPTDFYATGPKPTAKNPYGNVIEVTFAAEAFGSVQVTGAPTIPVPKPAPPPANAKVAKVMSAFGAFAKLWGSIFG